MPCERSTQISDGHRTDHLFSEERQIISGRLSVRPVTTFHTSTDRHRHTQHRSPHARRHALARDPLSTEILHGILFRFVRVTTPSDLNILTFKKRNSTVWNYNTTTLQGPTSIVCGHYCCLLPCTWTRGTHRNSSCDCFPVASRIGRSCSYSPETLDPCAGPREMGSAAYPHTNSKY